MKLFRKKELPQVEPVKIKPLFGMRPGLWLTIAYAIALVLLIFLIGFLPDIVNGHKRVTFTSTAGRVAVYVDDNYMGGTTFTTEVKSGVHTVSYRVNGCEIDSFTVKVGHPVFFNWLFPRTQKVESTAALTREAFEALTKEFLADVAAYSAVLEYDSVHRYPDLFTEYATSIRTSAYASEPDAFRAALLFVTTDAMYQDALTAMQMLSVSFPVAYANLGNGTVGTADAETPQVTAKSTSLKAGEMTIEGFTISAATFSNGKQVQNTYPEIMQAGETVSTQAFNIGAYCITENQYARFLSENPDWALANKDNLVAAGLVDEYYLDGVITSPSSTTQKPVRNISWYAANAFCQWLSSKTGKNVYLPTEDQWIAAAVSAKDSGFQRSLLPSAPEGAPTAMLGSVWEMTGSAFIPLSRIADSSLVAQARQILEDYGTPADMVVKGGSYISDYKTVDRYSVGTTYRSLCSDYMGFRIAWN